MNSPEKSAACDIYDPKSIPDYDREFIDPDDLRQFENALNDNESNSLVALNDWRPIYQRVRKNRGRRKKPRRTTDETREGVLYTVLKWPFLFIVFGWITVLGFAYALTRFYIVLYERWVSWRGKKESLRRELWKQTDYNNWLKAAQALDNHLGNQQWKEIDEYAYYDHLTINKLVNQLRKARTDVELQMRNGVSSSTVIPATEELCALLEGCVKNNFAGVENPRLYSETYSGTKNLVQEYIDEVEKCIQVVSNNKRVSSEDKYHHFKHLDTNFGRTALCLSGGATFAYYHFGVARALLDNGVLPEIITGTSGGALVAALIATRTDEELKQLLVPALAHRIRASSEGMASWIWRWWRTGARFDTITWARECSWFCRGSTTFKEAYERTGRILNVSCVPSDPHSPTILANYLTSPNCVIWSAVLASAAVPGILNPVVLMTKKRDGTLAPYSFGHKWKDGSLRTDIPIRALNLHFNVNFPIVSQVNPHINLFFFSSRGSVGRPVTHRRGRGWRGGFLGSAIEQYIKLDLNKWLRVLRHLELLPRPLGQDWSEIWLQKFSGTITIWPKTIPSDFYYILSDPTPERLARMLNVGQQSAFPMIQFIKNRLKIENAILKGLHQYSPAVSPAQSRRKRGHAGKPSDPMVERLDHNLPDRQPDNKEDLSDSSGIDSNVSSRDSSRLQPSSNRRSRRRSTGNIFQEMRRQSAVFFDDSDLYAEDDKKVE